MFCITVCSQDMKKVLMAIRKNGEEIGTLYDQNHIDNHRNSMASQTVVTELSPGDKIQVRNPFSGFKDFLLSISLLQLYMYTFSGLQDKKANHLTQFVGFLVTHL